MTSSAIVPSKPLEVAVAAARAEDLLRLWSVDLEKTPRQEARALCLTAIEAIQSGEPGRLASALVAPVRRRELALELDELIAAFPGMRKDADMTTFSRLLAEELITCKPAGAAVMHAAVRTLIRTSTFPPTIAEVVAAVISQQTLFQAQATLLERLPRHVAEIASELGEK